jgi:hypothetical protein
MDHTSLVKAAAGALAGAVLGWSASALTIAGRVDALEKTLGRIEQRLDSIATSAKGK